MKEVRIACPRCQASNTVGLATLKSNGGHVLCSECSFVFKVVPRRKSADGGTPTPEPVSAPKPHTQKLASAIQAISAAARAKHSSRAAEPVFLPVNSPAAAADSANMPVADESAPRPSTQAPSISILLKPTPAPVAAATRSQTLPFDLLEPAPPPAPAHNDGQVQIQAGNLVFTLLPSSNSNIEAAAPPIVINDAVAHSTEITQQQLALAAQQENLHRQFNWTLATLVALTVLIIQLFYLLSMQ